MLKSSPLIGFAAGVTALMAGCTASHWAVGKSAPRSAGPSAAAESTSDSRQVMAELQRLGPMDPASQRQFMSDWQQMPPALRETYVRQVRALAAYSGPDGQAASGPRLDVPVEPGRGVQRPILPAQRQVSGAASTVGPPPRSLAGGSSTPPATSPLPGGALPAIHQSGPQSNERLAIDRPAGDTETGNAAAGEALAEVVQASWGGPITGDFQGHLVAAAEDLHVSLAKTADTTQDPARRSAAHARLRLLYLLAGRRDEALQAIPDVDPAMSQYWTKQLYALDSLLDTQRIPDAEDRAAAAKQTLAEATAHLGELARLAVDNLTFCRAVRGFGCVKPFSRYEFVPGEEVLLYAEIENFAAESTAEGYETRLASNYRIFDEQGRSLVDVDLAVNEDCCRSARRDFFILFRLYMPQDIRSGRHTLKLTIEDLISHKVAQRSIEFTIKAAGG